MCPLGNYVRLSEAMQDKDLGNPLLGSSQKGLSADSLKGGKEKAKAKVRPSQMPCPRTRMMANSTKRHYPLLFVDNSLGRAGVTTTLKVVALRTHASSHITLSKW